MNELNKAGQMICLKCLLELNVSKINDVLFEELSNCAIKNTSIMANNFNQIVKKNFVNYVFRNSDLLNEYIENNFGCGENKIQSICILKNIVNKLRKSLDGNFIDYIELLLNNGIVKQNLENIIDIKVSKIDFKTLKSYTNDISLLTMFEMFCDKSNIEIFDDENSNTYDNSYRAYLKEISEIPLLTKEEEKKLGIRILANDKTAINELVEHNLRLVVKMANRNRAKYNVEVLDLIQYGNEGLILAAKRFDVNKGFKFSTYASWYIYQSIDRSVHKDIKNFASCESYSKVNKYRKAYVILEQKLLRKPSLNEIAQEMRITEEEVKEIIKLSTLTNIKSIYETVSGERTEDELIEFVVSNDDSLEEKIEADEKRERILYYFKEAGLTEREMKVLMLRMGFLNDMEYTLSEISKTYNISKERVRQIEIKAISKIMFSPYVYPFAVEMIDDYKKGLVYLEKYKLAVLSKKSNQYYMKDTFYNYFKGVDKQILIKGIRQLGSVQTSIIAKKYGSKLQSDAIALTNEEECDEFYKTIYDLSLIVKKEINKEKTKRIRKN